MVDNNNPTQTGQQLAKLSNIVQSIEQRTAATQNLVSTEIDDVNNLKTDILTIKNESQSKLVESNQKIITKIKEKFKDELNEGETQILENEEESKKIEKEIEELYQQIAAMDAESNSKILIYRRKLKELNDLRLQHKMLKESYDVAFKENENSMNQIDKTKLHSSMLDDQIEDMKIVIAKLADARVILNKYFTTHYETFTEEEKRLIGEIEGNIFPNYYNAGLNVPEVKPLTLNTEKKVEKLKSNNNKNNNSNNSNNNNNNVNSNFNASPNTFMPSQNNLVNISKNYPEINSQMMPKVPSNINNLKAGNKNAKKNYQSSGRIMNAEEYLDYQKRLKQESFPQLDRENNNQMQYSKKYGASDEYWHDKN